MQLPSIWASNGSKEFPGNVLCLLLDSMDLCYKFRVQTHYVSRVMKMRKTTLNGKLNKKI
jgi:hypothetical protein